MRVTSSTLPDRLAQQLATLLDRQSRLQNQATTGQRLQNAADDPAAAARVFQLQDQAASVSQFRRNISALQDVATASYDAIKSLKTLSDRANEIAVSADGLKSPEQLATYSQEVTQLIQQAVSLANSKVGNNYLFGGTRSNLPPFVLSTDDNGTPTSAAYRGNSTLPETELDTGMTFTAATAGSNDSASGPRGLMADARSGADFLGHLIDLQDKLVTGDTAGIAQTVLPHLQRDEDNFIYHLSSNATKQERLNASASLMTDKAKSVDSQISHQVDADLTETLVRLSEAQDAYKVAIQTGGSTLHMSLMDYLR
jgi:flagellar hook-associated protein 3 FlgL